MAKGTKRNLTAEQIVTLMQAYDEAQMVGKTKVDGATGQKIRPPRERSLLKRPIKDDIEAEGVYGTAKYFRSEQDEKEFKELVERLESSYAKGDRSSVGKAGKKKKKHAEQSP